MIKQLTSKMIKGLIRFYQNRLGSRKLIMRYLFLSDSLCRFSPTCSEYAHQAIDKHGVFRGLWLSWRRVLRCHPWALGGVDQVPG